MTHATHDDMPVMHGPSDRDAGDGSSWNDRDDLARLEKVDDFLVETRQFGSALRKIVRSYRRWTPGKDGRFIILHGPSGSGKTTVADAVLEEVERMEGGVIDVGEAPGPEDGCEIDDAEADDEEDGGGVTIGRLPRTAGLKMEGPDGYIRPIVKVFVEPRTRSMRLLRAIVRGLGARPALGASYAELVDMLNTQLIGQRTRMIILDEVHHMVDGQGADVIKMLLVQTRVQVVGIGLPHAVALASETSNDDLHRHVHALCPMGAMACDAGDDSEWRQFLCALSQEMPFDVKPDFAEAGLSTRLHAATEGLVGELMSLVEVATEIAIDDGLETIDLAVLDGAFRQTNDVGALATPFNMKTFSPEAYAPVRDRIKKRKSLGKSVAKANRRLEPDFRKS